MKKLITVALLIVTALTVSGCGNNSGIQEGATQKYYLADLEGDPNNRNVFRSTTVWSEEAAFELIIPDYWEVKVDKDDKYNTDIYLSSSEYEDDTCVVLPGTVGYGVSDDLEVEEWLTLIPSGQASDYYFYERISEEERQPVMRVVQFEDADGNYYILEMHFPEEGDYLSCHEDFSNIVTTFNMLEETLEETYVEAEIFQPKGITFAMKNMGSDEDRIVIEYAEDTWIVERDENGADYLKDMTGTCELHGGLETLDVTTWASYDDEVLVLDNNDMAKKYTLYDAEGAIDMVYVSLLHNDIVYNFEIREVDGDECVDQAQTVIQSFRTYAEELSVQSGIEMIDDTAAEADTQE